MIKLEERPWWPELVEKKDVLSLRELGSRYGVAPAAISNALKRSGLSREAAPPGPRDSRPAERKAAAAKALEAPAPTVQAPPAKTAKEPKAKAAPAAPKAAKTAKTAPAPSVQVVPLADLVVALSLEVSALKGEVASLNGELTALEGEVASLKADLIEIRAAAPGVSRLQLELGPWELDGKGLGWARPILPLAYAGALASEDGYRVFCGAGGEIRGEADGLEAAKAAADAVAVGMGYILNQAPTEPEPEGGTVQDGPPVLGPWVDKRGDWVREMGDFESVEVVEYYRNGEKGHEWTVWLASGAKGLEGAAPTLEAAKAEADAAAVELGYVLED